MKKRFISLLLAVVMVFALAACGGSGGGSATTAAPAPDTTAAPAETKETEAPAETEKDNSQITIGLSLSEISDNSKRYQDAYEAKCAELGVNVVTLNAQGSVDTQITNVENLIQQEVDVIHIRPLDADGLVSVIGEAQKAGIPVLVSEFDINCDVDCRIIATQNMCGELQAKVLIDKLEADPDLVLNVGYLWGSKARGSSVQQRYQGFMDTMKDYIDSGRVVILEEQEANFKSDEANSFVEDWLQRYPELNCVVCQNDEMANGSIQAAKTNNVDFNSFWVLGINGTEVGKQNIKDGYQLATVDMHEPEGAQLTCEYAVELAKGKTFDEILDISADIFELLTADNVQ
ncbi:MAG: sugar ABC transporter substrate-binding protein [Lachnospiraceae bacterium]|nr:sugar ABC transporter substrate-binding protein [Lachnospiraceae bacterium]